MISPLVDVLTYPPIQRAALACVLCGASCSLLSVFMVLMKMPLIGVSMSHAAFAGAVLGMLLDINPFLSGFVMCLVAAGASALSDRTDLAPENMLGILFSFLMGIAFLGMGILTRTRAGVLNLMWKSSQRFPASTSRYWPWSQASSSSSLPSSSRRFARSSSTGGSPGRAGCRKG